MVRPSGGPGLYLVESGASFPIPVCVRSSPSPSRGCAVRATPEGTPTLTTVLLTGFVNLRLEEAELTVEVPVTRLGRC